MAERLIVALDVDTVGEARQLVQRLDGVVSFFKIGFRLQIAEGFDDLVRDLVGSRRRVFLDTKMFDIPETVETAVRAAGRRGVSFVTVHGDEAIVQAAVRGRQGSQIKVFAVTALTSLSDAALKSMGYAVGARALVQLRAATAVACGCDGIIASADDDPDGIRALAGAPGLLIATPGIRRADNPSGDQARIATPEQAIENGADYLVVGRPIAAATDPAASAARFIADMHEGQRRRDGQRPLPG